MTKKRFTHKKWYNERQLFDGDEPFAIVDVYNQADKICDKFNELSEENQQLKNDCSILVQSNQEYRKENEQLKQLIKKTLETTPIEHTLAMELKNSVRELYD